MIICLIGVIFFLFLKFFLLILVLIMLFNIFVEVFEVMLGGRLRVLVVIIYRVKEVICKSRLMSLCRVVLRW